MLKTIRNTVIALVIVSGIAGGLYLFAHPPFPPEEQPGKTPDIARQAADAPLRPELSGGSSSNQTKTKPETAPPPKYGGGAVVVQTAQPAAVLAYVRSQGITVQNVTSAPKQLALITLEEDAGSPRISKLQDQFKDMKVSKSYSYQATSNFTPNDTYYGSQWNLGVIEAAKGWDVSTGASDVTIAIIDSGVLFNQSWGSQGPFIQPDFPSERQRQNVAETGTTSGGEACWNGTPENKATNGCDDDNNGYVDDWRGWDFMGGWNGDSTCPNFKAGTAADAYYTSDNDPQPYSCDSPTYPAALNKDHFNGSCTAFESACFVGHGTLVASVAAAATNNSAVIAGIDHRAAVMNLRVLDGYGYTSTSRVTEAVRYATANGADVINLSLAVSDCSQNFSDPVLENALQDAKAAGVTVVAASGNGGGSNVCYPASSSAAIAVGATDRDDTKASFSNGGSALDVVAPGVGIPSANASSKANTGDYEPGASGTSLSTPHVAGLAALLKAAVPSATPGDIYRYITSGADSVAGMNGNQRTDQYGYGRINVGESLKIYLARYKDQAPYPALKQAETKTVYISYYNDGTQTWYDDYAIANGSAPGDAKPVRLATARPTNRSSVFGSDWGGTSKTRATGTFATVYRADGTAYATNPHAVAPGESARFSFTLAAPAGLAPGAYREYFQPILEGTSAGSFAPSTSFLDVTVAAPTYKASFAGQSVYPTMTQNTVRKAFLSYKNIGNMTWYDDVGAASANAPAGTPPVRLATVRPTNRSSDFGGTWGGSQNRATGTFAAVYESNGTTLATDQNVAQPGQIVKFEFDLAASESYKPATYREYFAPVAEGVGVMRITTFLDVTVRAASFKAQFAGQSAYPTIASGSSATVFFKFKNIGNVAWLDSAERNSGVLPTHLATSRPINRFSNFNASFTTSNRPSLVFAAVYESDGSTLAPDQRVAQPGQIVMFEFTLAVSGAYPNGIYREWFQPVIEGARKWDMGGNVFLDVTVQG